MGAPAHAARVVNATAVAGAAATPPVPGAAWALSDLENDLRIERDRAVRTLKARLSAVPYDADARWELARRCATLHGYPQAIKQYKLLLRDRPEFHHARLELSDCYRTVQAWDGALREATYLLGAPRMADAAQRRIDGIKMAMKEG